MSFNNCSVKELQSYLRARGVTVTGQKRIALLELCQLAENVGIDIDPDGLIEDREEIIKDKLDIGNMICVIYRTRFLCTRFPRILIYCQK